MNVLAIDTATEACSVALVTGGTALAHFEIAGRTHTERLVPMVQALMAEAGLSFTQLDGYVCGIGPGSFAGVRIGLGFMKGLALAVDRPAVGVSSLEALALPALRAGGARVVSAIDARMNEVYFGGFVADAGRGVRAIVDEQVGAPGTMPRLEEAGWVAVGTGWGAYEAAMCAATGIAPLRVAGEVLPRAEDALAIGLPRLQAGEGVSLDALVPRYLRNKVALTVGEQQALRSTR
jgi:tRNA threonylcarbamoyladenosine biosynthesis protein TsaB